MLPKCSGGCNGQLMYSSYLERKGSAMWASGVWDCSLCGEKGNGERWSCKNCKVNECFKCRLPSGVQKRYKGFNENDKQTSPNRQQTSSTQSLCEELSTYKQILAERDLELHHHRALWSLSQSSGGFPTVNSEAASSPYPGNFQFMQNYISQAAMRTPPSHHPPCKLSPEVSLSQDYLRALNNQLAPSAEVKSNIPFKTTEMVNSQVMDSVTTPPNKVVREVPSSSAATSAAEGKPSVDTVDASPVQHIADGYQSPASSGLASHTTQSRSELQTPKHNSSYKETLREKMNQPNENLPHETSAPEDSSESYKQLTQSPLRKQSLISNVYSKQDEESDDGLPLKALVTQQNKVVDQSPDESTLRESTQENLPSDGVGNQRRSVPEVVITSQEADIVPVEGDKGYSTNESEQSAETLNTDTDDAADGDEEGHSAHESEHLNEIPSPDAVEDEERHSTHESEQSGEIPNTDSVGDADERQSLNSSEESKSITEDAVDSNTDDVISQTPDVNPSDELFQLDDQPYDSVVELERQLLGIENNETYDRRSNSLMQSQLGHDEDEGRGVPINEQHTETSMLSKAEEMHAAVKTPSPLQSDIQSSSNGVHDHDSNKGKGDNASYSEDFNDSTEENGSEEEEEEKSFPRAEGSAILQPIDDSSSDSFSELLGRGSSDFKRNPEQVAHPEAPPDDAMSDMDGFSDISDAPETTGRASKAEEDLIYNETRQREAMIRTEGSEWRVIQTEVMKYEDIITDLLLSVGDSKRLATHQSSCIDDEQRQRKELYTQEEIDRQSMQSTFSLRGSAIQDEADQQQLRLKSDWVCFSGGLSPISSPVKEESFEDMLRRQAADLNRTLSTTDTVQRRTTMKSRDGGDEDIEYSSGTADDMDDDDEYEDSDEDD